MERIWVMINDSCTYAVKVIITGLIQRGLKDMMDLFTMFSIWYMAKNVLKLYSIFSKTFETITLFLVSSVIC